MTPEQREAIIRTFLEVFDCVDDKKSETFFMDDSIDHTYGSVEKFISRAMEILDVVPKREYLLELSKHRMSLVEKVGTLKYNAAVDGLYLGTEVGKAKSRAQLEQAARLEQELSLLYLVEIEEKKDREK